MRRLRGHTKRNRVYSGGSSVKSTEAGLVRPTRSHAADFRRILPGQMDKLVAEGLFERLPHDELGRPQYRITDKGRQVLKDMEK